MGSALVLFALGASLDVVMEDYLLTNETLAPFRAYLLEEHAKTLSENVVNKFAYVYSVQEEFLQTALASINQHYGNIDTWLEKDIGLMRKVEKAYKTIFSNSEVIYIRLKMLCFFTEINRI